MTGVDGQTGSTSFSKRYCVSNSSGPAKKNDSVNRCWDLAQANLDANGKPQFNTARTGGLTCPCQFIDWDHDGNGGHVPGYNTAPPAPNPLNCADHSPTCGLTYINGASGHPMYRGPAPIVASAASFGDGSATRQGLVDRQHLQRQQPHHRHTRAGGRGHGGAVPVLQPAELGSGRILPARSGRPVPALHRGASWPGRGAYGRDRGVALQPLALLVLGYSFGAGAGCKVRPVPVPARA